MKTIPSTKRKEWNDLVNGHLEVDLTNFFFRTKVEQTRSLISQGKISTNNAINELHKICLELNKTSAVDDDIVTIFGKDIPKEETIAIVPTTENKKEKITIAENIQIKSKKNQEKFDLKKEKKSKEPISKTPLIKENISKEIKKKATINTVNNSPDDLSKIKDPEEEKELLRQASIKRRNKVLQESRDILRKKDKTSLSSIIKSIFN